MRMWNVNPEVLCRKHLFGCHVEMHMFIGSIKKGINLRGYIDKGLVEIHNIKSRHDALAEEMIRRGYKHNSPIDDIPLWNEGYVNVEENLKELQKRCPVCNNNISNANV